MLGYRRADLLDKAWNSFRASASGPVELVLVLNGATQEVKALADSWRRAESFPCLTVETEARRPGAARNLGVREARAPIILFLDDDIESFQDLAAAVREIFRDPEVKAAGGANLTPPGSGALERAVGALMQTFFGAASMRERYRSGSERRAGEHALILCNLAVRKCVFEEQGGFALHLLSNEENLLLQRLEATGAKLVHSPRLAVYHRRRNSWRGTWEQAAKYGGGRAQNLLILPASFRALYLIPAIFLLYLALSPLLAAQWGAIALAPLALYGAIAVAHGIAGFLARRDPAYLLLPLLFPFVHCAYGFGFLRACLTWGPRRKKLVEHAA